MPVLIVLPLLLLLLLGVGSTLLPELERREQLDLQRRTAVLATRIQLQLGNQIRQLQQLGRSPALHEPLRSPDMARAELDWLLAQQPAFVWIGLLAPDGRVLVGTRGWLEGESVGEGAVFLRALREVRVLGDFHPPTMLRQVMAGHADADSEVFDLAVRVDNAQGRPVGVLAAQVGGRWLQVLERHATEGLRPQGAPRSQLLTDSPPREIRGDGVVSSGTMAPLPPDLLAWAAADGTGAVPSRALASLVKVDTRSLGEQALSWRVLVLRDRADALQPAHSLMAAIALWGTLLAALLAASGFWAARRMTRPWQVLIDAAAREPDAAGAPLGRYADVVHDALASGSMEAGQVTGARNAADAVLTRLAADVRYIKRVLDHLPAGVVLSGPDFKIEYANSTLTTQLGLRNEDIRGQLDGAFLCYPLDAAPLAAQMRAMAADPGELAARLVARQADGSPRAVQWHFVPLFDSAGKFDGAISVVTDIDAETTARRRAAALHQRLKLLMEVAVDHALVLLNDEGHILSWNVGASCVFGRSEAQTAGHQFEDLFESEACAAGLPQGLLARARQDGRAPIDGPGKHATGRRLYLAGSVYAMPPPAWPAAYALIARDVTAQHQDAQRLAESEARLAAVVGGASDAIVSIDPSGGVEIFNPAAERIFGRDAASVLNRPLAQLLPSDASQAAMDAIVASQGSRRVQGLRADGARLDLEASVSKAQVGGRTLMIAILRDVTARLHSERELARYQVDLADLTQRLLAQEKETTRKLAQTLHDDLGQTLTAIRLTFDACRSVFPSTGKVADRLERLNGLITSGHRQVRRALVELRPPLLDDQGLAAALHNEVAVYRGAHPELLLQLVLPKALEDQRWPPSVEYAAFMIGREALMNAVQHGSAATIEARLSGGPQHLQLEVRDDGKGLPPDAARKPGHLGLVGMRERALAIGATLSVAACNERGTSVLLNWTEPEVQGETG